MYKELFNLENKTSLITGASSDIGRELAFALSEFGSEIILADIASKKEQLSMIKDSVIARGNKAEFYTFDISSLDEIERFVEEISIYKKIDILVNNAGINITNLALNVSENEWDKIMAVNLKGLFFLTRDICKIMVKNNYGKVINIASQTGIVGFAERTVYAASKMGVIGLSKNLAIELAKYNINVNCIAPTFTDTIMAKPLMENLDFLEEIKQKMPMGRVNKPIDLVGATIFLASRASDMVTGHTLLVDGGWTSL
jgi:2-dehydro-3-deoxy-D-gluconate 5-dehydrogenase